MTTTAPHEHGKVRSCDSCKHWVRYTTSERTWGVGQANPDDFGECQKVKFDYWQETGDHAFYVMDGSEYKAELTTRRDFYCNQYEVKP